MSQFAINLIWDPSVLSQPNAAQIEASITSAAQTFASNFSNPVTLNLHIGWGDVDGQPLDPTAVSANEQNLVYNSYAQVQAALPILPSVNPSSSNSVALTETQAAALGLSGETSVDAYIGFSSTSNFYFDQTSNTFNPGYWLSTVFDREVSKVMGRFADVGLNGQPNFSVLDFFRYTANGAHTFDPSVAAVFSLNGNPAQGIAFNSDPAGDYGDWSNSVAGDPFGAFSTGAKDLLSPFDLQAMTAVGWNATGATWDAAIFEAYSEEWLGRPLRSGEANTYLFDLAQGQTLSELRQTLLSTSEGMQHTDAEVTSLYQEWMGRAPTSAELTTWEGLVYAGDDFTAVRSAILADASGRAHTDATVTALYDTYFGRDPSASELATWEGLIAGGQDFASVRAALVSDAAGQAHIAAQVSFLYDTYFGRDPSAAELAVWQGLIASGQDFASVRAALVGDPVGQAHTTAEVTFLYDTYFGRDPNASELSVWQSLIAGGQDFNSVRAALVSDAAGQAHTAAEVTTLYETYFGRDPTAAELGVWQGLIASGHDFAYVRAALINDSSGHAYISAQVTSLYDTYFGRDPSAAEIGVWQGLIAGGADFGSLRAALLSDPVGQAHLTSEVTSLYDTYFGRDPTAQELAVWRGLIDQGDDFGTVRAALLSDATGQAHTAATVTSLYDTYFGRDPNPQEIAVWQGLIAGGDDFNALRSTLLADPTGQAHTTATVTSLYDTYFGRDPTAAELNVWHGLIAGGDDFNNLRAALLSDPTGHAHTDSTVTADYNAIFARAPTASELGVWEGLIAGGDTFDQLKDTLLRDPGSSAGGVHQVTVTAGQALTFNTTWNGAAVMNFDPLHNTIQLSTAEFGAINPLDASHAHQVTALDGSTDVLISLDATHSLLIEHTTLASLQSSDFVFS